MGAIGDQGGVAAEFVAKRTVELGTVCGQADDAEDRTNREQFFFVAAWVTSSSTMILHSDFAAWCLSGGGRPARQLIIPDWFVAMEIIQVRNKAQTVGSEVSC